jgi:hypothetical protein
LTRVCSNMFTCLSFLLGTPMLILTRCLVEYLFTWMVSSFQHSQIYKLFFPFTENVSLPLFFWMMYVLQHIQLTISQRWRSVCKRLFLTFSWQKCSKNLPTFEMP